MSYYKHKNREDIRHAYKCHFKRRLRERYDIDNITDEEIKSIVARIQARPRVGVISLGVRGGRSVKLVSIRGKDVVVVYSKTQKTLVTALPRDCGEWRDVAFYLERDGQYQTFRQQVGLSGSEWD